MALVKLAEYEAKAREILPLPVFDYYYGGAHDEITVHELDNLFQHRVEAGPAGIDSQGVPERPRHLGFTSFCLYYMLLRSVL
jgi:hypothetical protein